MWNETKIKQKQNNFVCVLFRFRFTYASGIKRVFGGLSELRPFAMADCNPSNTVILAIKTTKTRRTAPQTYQYSSGGRLSWYHSTGPVLRRRHPSNLRRVAVRALLSSVRVRAAARRRPSAAATMTRGGAGPLAQRPSEDPPAEHQ